MMQAHYTSILDLSDDALLASEKGFNRLMEALATLQSLTPASSNSDFDVTNWKASCYEAMNDDFNTPILIAHIFEAVKHINLIKEGKEQISEVDKTQLEETLHAFIFDILGLQQNTGDSKDTEKLSGVVELLIELRKDARVNKDFATSDRIRDQLAELGIQLKDGKEGTTFSIQ